MFKLQRIPLQIELLLSELQIFFNDYQWLHFRALLLSLLLTPYKATISGMVKILSYGSHRSKHNEFINDCNQKLTKVLRYYAMMILSYLKKTGEPIYFIIYDTTNKRRGKHIVAAFKFFDHISKQYIWGHQEEMRAQGRRLTEKNFALFSVLTMRDRIRHTAQVDSIEYCLETNSNKSKNKVITEKNVVGCLIMRST